MTSADLFPFGTYPEVLGPQASVVQSGYTRGRDLRGHRGVSMTSLVPLKGDRTLYASARWALYYPPTPKTPVHRS